MLSLIIITIGASILIRGLAGQFWGKDAVPLPAFSGETPHPPGRRAVAAAEPLGARHHAGGRWCSLQAAARRTPARQGAARLRDQPAAAGLVGIDAQAMSLAQLRPQRRPRGGRRHRHRPGHHDLLRRRHDAGAQRVRRRGARAASAASWARWRAGSVLGLVESLGRRPASAPPTRTPSPWACSSSCCSASGRHRQGEPSDRSFAGQTVERRRCRIGLLVAPGCSFRWLGNPYYTSLLIVIGIHTIVTVGLCLLMGYAGQVSLGHAAFYGLGAFTSGILSATYGVSPWLGHGRGRGWRRALIAYRHRPSRSSGCAATTWPWPRWASASSSTSCFVELKPVHRRSVRALPGIPPLALGGFVFDTDLKFYYLVWALLPGRAAGLPQHRRLAGRAGAAGHPRQRGGGRARWGSTSAASR